MFQTIWHELRHTSPILILLLCIHFTSRFFVRSKLFYIKQLPGWAKASFFTHSSNTPYYSSHPIYLQCSCRYHDLTIPFYIGQRRSLYLLLAVEKLVGFSLLSTILFPALTLLNSISLSESHLTCPI